MLPVLTSEYCFGRTRPSIIIGSSRNKIGSQKRIYAHMKLHGQGYQYEQYLFNIINLRPPNNSEVLNPFNPTGGGGQITTSPSYFTTGILVSNFYLTSGYNYFNFAIYGAGGSGQEAGEGTNGTGGGGSGAFMGAVSVPYSPSSGIYIKSIYYGVSGGGQSTNNSYIIINYNNSTSINLQVGQGGSTTNQTGTTGASGGVALYSNTTSFYNFNNITLVNGENGGNQGNSGKSNGYTSSGSGSDNYIAAPSGNPPKVSRTFNSITVTSAGGGESQIVSGYGAGGAATPANYNGNDNSYRTGSEGTIIYWLSS
jgi:hypothetical protein